MSFITLIFVVTCEVWWKAFRTSTSYTINLAAVAVVAIGCTGKRGRYVYSTLNIKAFLLKMTISLICNILLFTVQQSSFYGYTSMLPARYTQAVMVGESRTPSLAILSYLTRSLYLRCFWRLHFFRKGPHESFGIGITRQHRLLLHGIYFVSGDLFRHVPPGQTQRFHTVLYVTV